MEMKRCPACGSKDTVPMFKPGKFPLSLVSLKDTADESDSLPLHDIMICMCWQCSHVFNNNFDKYNVEYSKGCRMYNSGSGWKDHLADVRRMLEPLPVDKIVEIGAGDCEFLNSLNIDAEKIAVDPCEAVKKAFEYNIDFSQQNFDVNEDIPQTGSLLVIMRHLLEHMSDPRDFLEEITSFARNNRSHDTFIYIEVPCCEVALESCRVEDWTYEHPQHFTVNSMKALLHACQVDHMMVLPRYNREVLSVLVQIDPEPQPPIGGMIDVTDAYYNIQDGIDEAREWVRDHVDEVVFWGGAGKSAMMLHILQVPEHTLVVDSDPNKWGLFVPGTRIEIKSPECLTGLEGIVRSTVVATASWRANDIRDEIVGRGLTCVKRLLKLGYNGFEEVPLGQ